MLDLGVATCKALPEPDPDAELLAQALTEHGIRYQMLAWDDPWVDWSQCKLVLVRSTWNYILNRPAFVDWAHRVESVTTLLNSAATIEWNTHKSYLAKLKQLGVATVPTEFFECGPNEPPHLESVLEQRNWNDIVIKPTVSAGSYLTYRMNRATLDQELFSQLLSERDMMIQPFVESIDTYGERSLVHIGGTLTHAIRKSPRFGNDSEAIDGPFPISDAERALAASVLAAATKSIGVHANEFTYARVDLATDSHGNPMLMELELTEPSLFFAQGPIALENLCKLLTAASIDDSKPQPR